MNAKRGTEMQNSCCRKCFEDEHGTTVLQWTKSFSIVAVQSTESGQRSPCQRRLLFEAKERHDIHGKQQKHKCQEAEVLAHRGQHRTTKQPENRNTIRLVDSI